MTTDMEKSEVLHFFFFDSASYLPTSLKCLSLKARKEVVCNKGKYQVLDCLRKLNIYLSVGPNEMCARAPRELADTVAKPLFILFEKSWLSG